MGTRNYLYVGGSVSVNLYEYQAMGTAWAQMVVATNTGLGTYGSQTKIVGATDSELDWNTPDLTLAWGTAYSNANGFPYYDFGDAAGCSTTVTSTCDNGWATNTVYQMSWGIPAAGAMPEIYRTDAVQASQWKQISLYGANHGSPYKIVFAGALTELSACLYDDTIFPPGSPYRCPANIRNAPATGWMQLYNALSTNSLTALAAYQMPWSSDIDWQQ